jgi:hypothetical protein
MHTEQNKKTEEILSSLDGINRASAPDFFYTRVKAVLQSRINEEQTIKESSRLWTLRPVYAVVTMVVVLLVNSFVLLQKKNSNAAINSNETESIQSIAAEYSLNDNNSSLYDLNQDK